MSRATSIGALVAATAVAAIYAYVSYPWTKEQCGRWAAERNGEFAVKAALMFCRDRFGKRAEDQTRNATIAAPNDPIAKGTDSQESRPPDFDIQAARREGYSDDEIADRMSARRGFDSAGARRAGYTSSDIIERLRHPDPVKPQQPKEFSGTLDVRGEKPAPGSPATSWAPNGQPWPTVAGYLKGKGIRQRASGGLSELTIDNTSGAADVYVKLCRASADRCEGLRHVFIPLGASFTMSSVAPGRYDVRYRSLDNGTLAKSEPIDLMQVNEAGGTRYSSVRLTLYRVKGGNTNFESLPEDKF
jgi:hypothetical protein